MKCALSLLNVKKQMRKKIYYMQKWYEMHLTRKAQKDTLSGKVLLPAGSSATLKHESTCVRQFYIKTVHNITYFRFSVAIKHSLFERLKS